MKLPDFQRPLRQLVLFPLLLLALMAGFLFWQIMAGTGAQQRLNQSDRLTTQIQDLQKLIIDQESGLRGFQLTGEVAMLAPWQAAEAPIQSHFVSLRGQLSGDPAQEQALAALQARYAQWLAFAQSVLGKDPAALADPQLNQRGKALMDAVRGSVQEMLASQRERRRAIYQHARWMQGEELISLLISVLLIGLVLALFIRSRVRRISASYRRRIAEITAQKEELFESQQWFQTTLESIGDAVIACDVHGAVSFMNAVAERLTGWPVAEAKGRSLEEIFSVVHEETRTRAENPVEKVLRTRQVIGLANHTLLLARDGREYAIDDSAAPILSGDGEMIGVVLVFRDVTEDRKMHTALMATEKLAVAGRLAASIAHEIHNPLDSVANLHYLMGEETNPQLRTEYLRLAQQELQRTMQISRTMLSLYREPKAPVVIELQELIEGVLLLLDRRLQNQGIRVEKELSDSLTVEGYPAELRQVFTNLVSNAMEAAGAKGRIRIRMEAAEAQELSGSGALIEIADSGSGISAEAMPKLFQPFFTTKGVNGTGLGLWVSMGIVQKHGGAIRAANCSDSLLSGACMRVFLPARTLAQANRQEVTV